MGTLTVATGVALLRDEGLLPPNPARQAIAFASPAEQAELRSQGLAMKSTAVELAMDDDASNGTTLLRKPCSF